MLNIGIIGCGKIADQHAYNIQRTGKGNILAVCDSEPLMAEQFADRFLVKNIYTDIEEMLSSNNFDAIHITTPPSSHLFLAKKCIKAGTHVYVEKPFTVNYSEAEELLYFAKLHERIVTVGHNLQFSHAALNLRRLVKEGFLGGDPIHMESYYCYDLSVPKYAMAILGDSNHWVRKLPGKLLHNLISHGICKIAEYLSDQDPEVQVIGFPSKTMLSINESGIKDEIRVSIKSSDGMTAYFTCSTQLKPALRAFRIYGPLNSIYIDEDQQAIFKLYGKRYKSYLNQFYPPFIYAKQSIANAVRNVKYFLLNEFYSDHGMKNLINEFYISIEANSNPPIPYPEILLVTKIMDQIFQKI
jgi:predicted dehydrogenase